MSTGTLAFDFFSANNVDFGNYISAIYPSELELKDTSTSSTEVCYLDTNIKTGENTPFRISIYTIRERTLHFALSTLLIWTATFPTVLLTVFIHLFQLRLLQRRMMHDPFFIARGALL